MQYKSRRSILIHKIDDMSRCGLSSDEHASDGKTTEVLTGPKGLWSVVAKGVQNAHFVHLLLQVENKLIVYLVFNFRFIHPNTRICNELVLQKLGFVSSQLTLDIDAYNAPYFHD